MAAATEIDRVQRLDVARIERLHDGDEAARVEIALDMERGQPREAEAGQHERAQRLAVADARGTVDRQARRAAAAFAQRPGLGAVRVVEAEPHVVFEFLDRRRRAMPA